MQTEETRPSSSGREKTAAPAALPFRLEMPRKLTRQRSNETVPLTLPHSHDVSTKEGALCQENGVMDTTNDSIEHENGAVIKGNNSNYLSVDSKSDLTSPSSPDSETIQLQRARRESEFYEGDISSESDGDVSPQSDIEPDKGPEAGKLAKDKTCMIEESDTLSKVKEQEQKVGVHSTHDIKHDM